MKNFVSTEDASVGDIMIVPVQRVQRKRRKHDWTRPFFVLGRIVKEQYQVR